MAQVFDDRGCILGEGALWHPEREQLFWFDILEGKLLSRSGGKPHEWRFEEMVSAAGWVDRSRLLIASETSLFLFDLDTGAAQEVVPLEADNMETRSNDGRADPFGGFWIGTMGRDAAPEAGAIYRFFDGQLRRIYSGITIPNAICFAPDGKTAYFTDSPTHKVMAQPLGAEGWPEGERRPYLDLAPRGLNPDGAVIDASGAFCVACWGDGAVRRFDPQGHELDRIAVGGLHASCPAIGGSDMQDLLVTTARQGMTDPDPAQGLPYLTRAPAPGLPEPKVIL